MAKTRAGGSPRNCRNAELNFDERKMPTRAGCKIDKVVAFLLEKHGDVVYSSSDTCHRADMRGGNRKWLLIEDDQCKQDLSTMKQRLTEICEYPGDM